MENPIFMTIQEASRTLCISENLAWKMVKSGQLAGTRLGKRWLIEREALRKLVSNAAATVQPPPAAVALKDKGNRAILAVLSELRRDFKKLESDIVNCNLAMLSDIRSDLKHLADVFDDRKRRLSAVPERHSDETA